MYYFLDLPQDDERQQHQHTGKGCFRTHEEDESAVSTMRITYTEWRTHSFFWFFLLSISWRRPPALCQSSNYDPNYSFRAFFFASPLFIMSEWMARFGNVETSYGRQKYDFDFLGSVDAKYWSETSMTHIWSIYYLLFFDQLWRQYDV